MVLEQRIDASTLDDIAVDDVVFDVVAVVHHKGEVHHQPCAVALAVAAGVRLVGRKPVVNLELRLRESIHDEAAAGALRIRGEIHVTAHHVQVVVLDGVRVNRDVDDGVRRVRMDHRLLAAKKT